MAARCERYGFKIVTRAEFDRAKDVPSGLHKRMAEYPGAFVLYDPSDDKDGFALVGESKRSLGLAWCQHYAECR